MGSSNKICICIKHLFETMLASICIRIDRQMQNIIFFLAIMIQLSIV